MTRRIMVWCFLLALCCGPARAAEKTAANYVPSDAWLVAWYDGTHPGLAETPLARFLQEPEVKDALKQLQPVLDKVLEEGNKEAGFDLAPVLRTALGCEIVLAFLAPRPGEDTPTALIVANVGTGEATARRHAEALMKWNLADAKPETVRRVDIGGIQATTFTEKDGEPSAFGFDGPFFLMANGEDILKRMVDPATPKLADKAAGERAVFRLRYDHLAMLKAFGNQIEPETRRVLEGIGVNAVSAAELAFVPRGRQMAASLAIDLPAGANRQGLLRGLAQASAYDPAMLKHVPRDAMLFWQGNVDFAWVWDELWATVARLDANAANEARQGLAKLEEAAGVKVRDGLLAPLGQGTLLVSRPEGTVGGWSAIVQRMRDPDAFEKAVTQLVARLDMLLMGLPDAGAVRTDLKTFQYRGHTCRYLWAMGAPAVMLPYWTPCYARLGNEMAFAANPLQLKGFLDFVEDKGPTIEANEEFRALLAAVPKGATSVGYTSWADGIEAAYNTLAPLLALCQGIPELQGKLDLANLPSSRLIRRYLKGTIAYTVFENGRFRAEAQSEGLDTLGPNAVVMAPALLAGMLLPAMSKARTEARRIRDRNNLNQIAKACATYLNEFGDNRFYPKGIAELVDKGVIPKEVAREVLVSPLDPDPPKLANGVPCSYVSVFDKYPNRVFRDDFPPNEIMAWIRKPFPAGGRNILFFDSHVEFWINEAQFAEAMKALDQQVMKLTKERQPGKEGEPKPGPAKGEL